MTKTELLKQYYLSAASILEELLTYGKPVFGTGNPDNGIMLVGEAPGKNEADAGIPFIGKAGSNLDSWLNLAHIKREDIFITNSVKIRPISQGKKGFINRAPNKKELDVCKQILNKEIEIISPKLIVTLGNTALNSFFKTPISIGTVHGTVLKHPDISGIDIYPMYHPASLIYNRSLIETAETDVINLGNLLNKNNI